MNTTQDTDTTNSAQEAGQDAYVPLTKEEMEESDTQEREWCLADMRKLESKWKEQRYCFAWITEPMWEGGVSDFWFIFDLINEGKIFPQPKRPCKRIMRFSLLGGGQIRTSETFVLRKEPDDVLGTVWCSRLDLKVTAHTDDGIKILTGRKEKAIGLAMQAEAVALTGKNQDIADRTAATFRLFDNEIENLLALLDGSEGCSICRRPLRDEISKLIAVGPCCAKNYGVPYSREAAERRLTLRRKLLGES